MDILFLKKTNKYIMDIVVSHYNEDLSWLNKIKKDNSIFIYSKTSDCYEQFNVVRQEKNIGNEASSYLKHIVLNYDKLSEYTYFCHGHEYSNHQNYNNSYIINNVNLNLTSGDILYLNTNNFYNEINENHTKTIFSSGEICMANNLPYIIITEFFENFKNLFNQKLKNINSYACAQFIVHRLKILSNSLDFYKILLDWFESEESLKIDKKYKASNNVYSSRIFEWLWYYIFNKNEEETIHTEPIGNLEKFLNK